MAEKSSESKSKTTKKSAVKKDSPSQKKRIHKPFFIFVIGFFLFIVSLYIFKGIFIAAMVNGESINRIVVVKELEKQNGTAVLENLITQKLILQEAKKRNIEVTGDEVNLEIIKIEENLTTQGTTLDQALQLQGMTRDQLVNEIKIQQAIQKMVSEDIEISDEEINEFITENTEQFPDGTTDEAMKTQAREVLLSQSLQEKTQTFLEELRAKAIIKTYTSY